MKNKELKLKDIYLTELKTIMSDVGELSLSILSNSFIVETNEEDIQKIYAIINFLKNIKNVCKNTFISIIDKNNSKLFLEIYNYDLRFIIQNESNPAPYFVLSIDKDTKTIKQIISFLRGWIRRAELRSFE